jgi:hypothetical protein
LVIAPAETDAQVVGGEGDLDTGDSAHFVVGAAAGRGVVFELFDVFVDGEGQGRAVADLHQARGRTGDSQIDLAAAQVAVVVHGVSPSGFRFGRWVGVRFCA